MLIGGGRGSGGHEGQQHVYPNKSNINQILSGTKILNIEAIQRSYYCLKSTLFYNLKNEV